MELHFQFLNIRQLIEEEHSFRLYFTKYLSGLDFFSEENADLQAEQIKQNFVIMP